MKARKQRITLNQDQLRSLMAGKTLKDDLDRARQNAEVSPDLGQCRREVHICRAVDDALNNQTFVASVYVLDRLASLRVRLKGKARDHDCKQTRLLDVDRVTGEVLS